MIENYKEIFVFLLMAHVLGDFYFQNESMAVKKDKSIQWVAIHSIIYGLINCFFVKIVICDFANTYLFILIISHFIVDILKFYWIKSKFLIKWQKNAFLYDQVLHLLILLIVSFYVVKNDSVYHYRTEVQEIFTIMGLQIAAFFNVTLKILLIHKPVNIFIVSIIKAYKPSNNNENSTIKAGRAIGTMERIIMLFFVLIQQYASIGLVLTAKSIARYNKISEDQAFAEYYLLGTLLSTICILTISLL